RDARDRSRLEAEELPDAVVLMDDVVAGSQVGERLQRASDAGRLGPRRALAEELSVRQQDEVQVAPDEASPRRRDGETRLRLVVEDVVRLEQRRVDAAEQVLGAQGLAAMWERDDDAMARAREGVQLVLGFGEAARGKRRPLCLECKRLAGRKLVELG